ncbi:MAG: hypothetical protein PHE78_01795 [Candidatus Gastranaerophilales bacterium]|nr:hypothetical protein [Candidatus Gastranaerophilales bacterium]
MHHLSIFEVLMLICFGASWPFAVIKTYKTKNVKGKSIIFLSLVIIGYLCGMMHKILYNPDAVIWLYALNCLLVSADMVMWFKYRKNA